MFKTKKEKLLLEHMSNMETIKYLVVYSIMTRGSACVDKSKLIKGSEEERFNEVYERTIANLVDRSTEIFIHFDKKHDCHKIFNEHFSSFNLMKDPDGIFSVYTPELAEAERVMKSEKFSGDIVEAVLEAAGRKPNQRERRSPENSRGFHVV